MVPLRLVTTPVTMLPVVAFSVVINPTLDLKVSMVPIPVAEMLLLITLVTMPVVMLAVLKLPVV